MGCLLFLFAIFGMVFYQIQIIDCITSFLHKDGDRMRRIGKLKSKGAISNHLTTTSSFHTLKDFLISYKSTLSCSNRRIYEINYIKCFKSNEMYCFSNILFFLIEIWNIPIKRLVIPWFNLHACKYFDS